MILYVDTRFTTINFALDDLKQSLRRRGIFFLERRRSDFTGFQAESAGILVSIDRTGRENPESYEIRRVGGGIEITGGGHVGAMYGVLDVAETIGMFGLEAVTDKRETPYHETRGVKFNLPVEPYDTGDPIEKNWVTFLERGFWQEYINFLARNRYNCLSLWSEHPFHMMFRLARYPDTCPYDDRELESYKDLFKFIFSHARKRGIRTYIITWNIRMIPAIAAGLGLPAELGEMYERYDYVYRNHLRLPQNIQETYSIRQQQEVVRDYYRECVKTLLMTYKDLTGLGTSTSEEMSGTPEERQQWVVDTYLEGVRQSGRKVEFIHRTNSSSGRVTKELFFDKYDCGTSYISWKYSNAHMYSHPEPKFEELWNTWDGVDTSDVNLLYTVRNDDIHTFRFGSPEFTAAYLRRMKKPNVRGYYWGADGYLWGDDFQTVPHKRIGWRYDFERHWFQFELLGRLGYNPDIAEEFWIARFKLHYGEAWGELFYRALTAVSGFLPAVNRLFWIDYDFEWHPETLLTVFGFKSVLDFMRGKAMPGTDTVSLADFVAGELSGETATGETPEDIIGIIGTAVEGTRDLTRELRESIPREYLGGDILATLLDIEALTELGDYYRRKFRAALELLRFESGGEDSRKASAIAELEDALSCWKELSRIASLQYLPYKMVRSKYFNGWSFYVEEAEKDIELARNLPARRR